MDTYTFTATKACTACPNQADLLMTYFLINLLHMDTTKVRHTHRLRKHETRPVMFTLVINDFRIKYIGKEHLDHLLNELKQDY
jgi:hypothetical protein